MKFKKNMKDEFMENVYESIGCKNIAELSRHLEVDRSALSSILNGNKNCSNIRLPQIPMSEIVFLTAEFWQNLTAEFLPSQPPIF